MKNRKPLNSPRNDDLQLLHNECGKVMKAADMFDIGDSYVSLRAATQIYIFIMLEEVVNQLDFKCSKRKKH